LNEGVLLKPETGEVGRVNAKIRRALTLPGSFTFRDAPLGDVAKQIEAAYDIPVKLDTRALDGVGIGSDSPVTRSLRNVSLKTALRLMLKDLELEYGVVEGVLLFSTPEELESNYITRIYAVHDLVGAVNSTLADFDWLVNLISHTISRETWLEGTGPIQEIQTFSSNGKHLLFVSQREHVHEKIADLLKQLRAQQPVVTKPKLVMQVYEVGHDFEQAEQIGNVVRKHLGVKDGGRVILMGLKLAIIHTPDSHEQARRLIEDLLLPGELGFGTDYYKDRSWLYE